LVGTGDETAEMLRGALGLVERGEKGESSNTVTSDETTNHSLFPGEHGRGFDGETDHEDEEGEEVGNLDTESSRDFGHGEGTDEGSEGHERGDEGLTSRGNGEARCRGGIRFSESTSIYVE